MRRYAARADGNQKDIVAGLRSAGAAVAPTHTVGAGFPDLLVGFEGKNILMEVKDPSKPKNDQRLTPAQVKFHSEWPIQIHVVFTVQEAKEALRK